MAQVQNGDYIPTEGVSAKTNEKLIGSREDFGSSIYDYSLMFEMHHVYRAFKIEEVPVGGIPFPVVVPEDGLVHFLANIYVMDKDPDDQCTLRNGRIPEPHYRVYASSFDLLDGKGGYFDDQFAIVNLTKDNCKPVDRQAAIPDGKPLLVFGMVYKEAGCGSGHNSARYVTVAAFEDKSTYPGQTLCAAREAAWQQYTNGLQASLSALGVELESVKAQLKAKAK